MTIHVLSSESFLVILCGKCNSRSYCVRQSPSACLAVTVTVWVWIGLWQPVCLPPASLCWRKRRLRPCAVRWHPGCTERMALLMMLCVWWPDRLHVCKLELGTLAVVSGKIHGRHSVCTRMGTIGHPAPRDCHAHPCSHDIFPSSGDQGSQEGSALARWAADPANTAWMESKCRWPRSLDPPPLKLLQVPEDGSTSPFLET